MAYELNADIMKINKHQKSSGNAIIRAPRILTQMYGLQTFDDTLINLDDYDTIFIGSPSWVNFNF